MSPRRPLRPCNQPGCPTLVDRGYCPAHQRQRTQRRGSSTAQGYGAQWRKIRAVVLAEEPICRACGKAGSVDVDHVIARERGGTDERANLQGLCRSCHSTKTAREDGGFGRAPGRGR